MTWQQEENFPRGKDSDIPFKNSNRVTSPAILKRKNKANEESELSLSKDDDDLFKISKPVKPKKKKSSNDLTSEEVDLLINEKKATTREFVIESLNYESICEGLLSLGRISKIKSKELLISLPCRTVGAVPITAISSAYTEALDKIVTRGSFTEDEKEQVHLVDQMFKVGQVVAVKVVNVDRTKKLVRVVLSLNPSDIHRNYNATNLVEGMNLTSAVKSIEDNGYIMDTGIKGVTAFLPHGAAKSFIRNENDNKQLGIGQLVYCKITKCNIHRLMAKITLTTSVKEVAGALVPDCMGLNYSLLLPGMMVDGTVTNIHKSGMKVYFSEMSGLIHKDHMNTLWDQPMQSNMAESITPRVLYILPNGVSPYLTLKTGFCPYTFSKKNQQRTTKYEVGHIVNVSVNRIEKRGIIIKFPNEEKGIVVSQRLSDDLTLKDEDIGKQFPVGSRHDCRILGHCFMDNVYTCSFQKSVLTMKYGNVSQVKPGDCVTCKIVKWTQSGAIVNFESIKGFIPTIHFGDIPISNPQNKYPVGSSVKTRVMSHFNNQILLSAKKKLMKSDGAILSKFEDVQLGLLGEAMVSRISKAGLNVYLLGGLSGFIPASQVANPKIEDLESVFFVGKIVRYKVLDADEKLNKLILTLLLDDDSNVPKENSEKLNDSQKSSKKSKNEEANRKRKLELSEEKAVSDEPISKKKKKKKVKRTNDVEVEVIPTEENETTCEIVEVDDNVKIEVKEEEDTDAAVIQQDQDVGKDKETKKKKKRKSDKAIAQKLGKEEKNPEPKIILELPTESFWSVTKLKIERSDASSESEDDALTKTNTASKTKKMDRNAKELMRQRELRDKELALNDPERAPGSIEDFERMVFASPNSSMVWLAYMVFYIESAEIDKARSVAKKALTRISYNEDQEKTNIWCALLNLEIDHGTKETVKETFDEACRRCDDYLIYKHTIDTYLKFEKFQEAQDLQNVRLKKFPRKVEVWKTQADLLCKYMKKSHETSKLLERCSVHINKKDYVDLANHIARLEMKHGNVERGKTMFETTLESFPKRSDIWIMYAKMLIHIKKFDEARNIFNRAIETSLLKKKALYSIFKDALAFEKEHGNEKTLNQLETNIKAKCEDFANSLSTLTA